jgi:hypothetical protein
MFINHPDLVLAVAHNRQRELIAEADRRRLLAAARRTRRGNAAASTAPRGRPANIGAAAPAQ